MVIKLLCAVLLVCVSPGLVMAFDNTGLQPISPYGVFSTFSTESLPKNKVGLEVTAERAIDPEFYRFGIKGAYGLTDAIEFNFSAPYIFKYANAVDGPEDFSFGWKHRVYDEGKYGPSLAYIVSTSINNGRKEFSTNGRIGVGFIASKRVGPFKGHLNIFAANPGTAALKSEVSFSGGIDFSAANNLNLLGELVIKKGHTTKEYDQVETRLGYRIKTTDFLYTTLGVGIDLKDKGPEYRFILSVSLTSPHKKTVIKRIYEEE
ncbi:MAG: hypothetical protein EPN25_01490 [Nitrospirae bacterium]|nr:MAG: hypothetical protein EPN25_01490 [Nitrospirota bacterium]